MVVAKVVMTTLAGIGVLFVGFVVAEIIYDAITDWFEKHQK